jgi:RNAse (barnase) inhibitor barstar
MSHQMQEKPDRIVASPKVCKDYLSTLHALDDGLHKRLNYPINLVFKGILITQNLNAIEDAMEFYKGDKLLMKINRVGV